MITLNFYADKPNTEAKEALKAALEEVKNKKVDYFITIGQDKTSKQLRGFYRICNILAPYFSEANGVFFDKDMVKEYVKQECNYCVVVKGKMITKSLTKATRQEMRGLIEKLYELGSFFNAKDYKLTSNETQALIEYYNKQ